MIFLFIIQNKIQAESLKWVAETIQMNLVQPVIIMRTLSQGGGGISVTVTKHSGFQKYWKLSFYSRLRLRWRLLYATRITANASLIQDVRLGFRYYVTSCYPWFRVEFYIFWNFLTLVLAAHVRMTNLFSTYLTFIIMFWTIQTISLKFIDMLFWWIVLLLSVRDLL